MLERGGTLGRDDLAAYEPIAREPVRATYRGRQMLTNPPPSSGGVLIAYALAILERLGEPDLESVVGAMEAAQAARTDAFLDGLRAEGFEREFLDSAGVGQRGQSRSPTGARRWRAPRAPTTGSARPPTSPPSTATVAAPASPARTAPARGVIVPGTGVHVNNMLGEEDLNPLGFHRHRPGDADAVDDVSDGPAVRGRARGRPGQRRLEPDPLGRAADGAAPGRRRRRRSATAVRAPRVHFEAGAVQAEPGVDEIALERLEARGYEIVRWAERNVFFGGVHAVARDRSSGALSGGGDPRRGGAVAEA